MHVRSIFFEGGANLSDNNPGEEDRGGSEIAITTYIFPKIFKILNRENSEGRENDIKLLF